MNPHALDGSNVVIKADSTNPDCEVHRLPYELSMATDEEVMLWKLENAG